MRTIRGEMFDPAPAGRLLVETLAAALGVHILRHRSNLTPASASLPAARGALDPRRLRRVVEFMEAHLGEDLTLGRLADEACLSPFHFARAFKAATGTAPHRFLTARRIDRARALLAEGELSLAGVAEICGFSSQAHFTRSFKRLVGATPGEYRGGCGGVAGRLEQSSGSAAMKMTTERRDDVLIVGVTGRIDAAGAETFGEALHDAIRDADRAVVLDLEGLAYMGSTGLRAILLIAKELASRDARLALCALPAPILRVFRITGFERMLPIHATRADALASLERDRASPHAP
ncbi:MAG: anti-sigma factor antagonist [Defluviicoccus sp.]|nr:anti-sigma factor antagonist [Defluviicoccus sp.]